MSESFSVQSKINGSYEVNFISDLKVQINKNLEIGKCIFVVDQYILKLYVGELNSLLANGRFVEINSGEKNKTVDYSQEVIRKLISLNVRKDDKLIAIGGGIIQDIVAFVSSILFRGIEWQFYPTTLLAQCDSCIGSKSSINFDQYKNLLGTFNPPSNIYIYPHFLNTLTESEIRSGIGEMLHYFFTDGIDLAQQVSDQFEELLNDRLKLSGFISNSLRIKKKIIEIY